MMSADREGTLQRRSAHSSFVSSVLAAMLNVAACGSRVSNLSGPQAATVLLGQCARPKLTQLVPWQDLTKRKQRAFIFHL